MVRFSCKKSGSIIRRIVGRLHVSASDGEVGDYAVSRMKEGLSSSTYAAVRKCAVKMHHENRGLFRSVSSGRLGGHSRRRR